MELLAQLDAEGSQALSSPHPFFNKDERLLDDDPSKSQFPKLHKDQVAKAISLIIDSAPNLQSVEIRGKALFPFCKRVLTDAKPLKWLSNLKELKLVRGLERGQILSARNLIWLLALPNISKATLCVNVGKNDVKYLQDHEIVMSQGISRVKDSNLMVKIEGSVGMDKPQSSRMILSSIIGLEHLKVKSEGDWEMNPPLEGLKKHSASSLR